MSRLESLEKLKGVNRAISMYQPWAWLVAAGWKPLENRSQCFKYRGAVALHASKTLAPLEERYTALDLLLKEAADRSGPDFEDWRELTDQFHDATWQPKFKGAFIGIATVVGCLHESDSKWFFGPHALVMNTPELFDEPVPWRGQLGIWKITREGRIE